MEADDPRVPLLERLKFISIFGTNLDEFFMIRVGSLFDLKAAENDPVDKKSGMTVSEQLHEIYNVTRKLCRKRDALYAGLLKEMSYYDIFCPKWDDLSDEEQKFVHHYFKNEVEPLLSPQIMDPTHPFPYLVNKRTYAGLQLERGKRKVFGMIPVPDALPDIIFLPGSDNRYVNVEDIVLYYADKVFDMYKCCEKVKFAITRNADISPESGGETVDFDYRIRMKKMLKKRQRLDIVRLELSSPVSDELKDFLTKRMRINDRQIFITETPFLLKYVFDLPDMIQSNARESMLYKPYVPVRSIAIDEEKSIFDQIKKKDVLLSYPYESMEPFLRLLRESANDPRVISVKITIYRLARKARLVDYLCAAAENGKDVTVLIELRARFDEQNNIDWSQRLEEAGCKVIYGIEDFKVHSKICLITRRTDEGIESVV